MDYIKHLISQGQLSEALEHFLLANPEDDDAVILLNRLTELETKSRLGLVSEEESLKTFNQITSTIMDRFED